MGYIFTKFRHPNSKSKNKGDYVMMKTKTKVLTLCLSILLLFAASLAAWALSDSAASTADVEPASEHLSSSIPLYMIRGHEGKVAVFPFGENVPSEVTDIRIDSLPPYDQENMKNGIPAYSNEQCQRILEDFD